MMHAGALLCALLLGAVFDVQQVPLPSASAQFFIAQGDSDGQADFFVLEGRTLRIFRNSSENESQTISLPPGASAIDVADIDADGAPEVIVVAGERFLAYRVRLDAEGNQSSAPRELFSLRTQLSAAGAGPFPHAMAMRQDEDGYFLLPRGGAFEVRTFAGDFVARHPFADSAPGLDRFTQTFSRWGVDPPQAGPAGALEFRVRGITAQNAEYMPEALLPASPAPLLRRGTPGQARAAAALDPEAWPWFALRRDAPSDSRALFALSSSSSPDTLIRIRRPARLSGEKTGDLRVGPVRRYPGAIVTDEKNLPDFNGDGYTDLVLWKASEAVHTLNAITKILVRKTWAIRVTVHLYSQEKGRFEAQPAAYLDLSAPVDWLQGRGLGAVPLQHVSLRDFNGDGKTDFACSVAPATYAAWLFGEEGFAKEADFQQTFEEAILRIEAQDGLRGDGGTSLVLRGPRHVFVLKARPGE